MKDQFVKKKDPVITLGMTVLEVVSQWESTQVVFKRWDNIAGECICCNCLFGSIEDLSGKYGLDTNKLLTELNRAAAE